MGEATRAVRRAAKAAFAAASLLAIVVTLLALLATAVRAEGGTWGGTAEGRAPIQAVLDRDGWIAWHAPATFNDILDRLELGEAAAAEAREWEAAAVAERERSVALAEQVATLEAERMRLVALVDQRTRELEAAERLVLSRPRRRDLYLAGFIGFGACEVVNWFDP